ncbi:alpha-L-fucosidase C-terminal domain-containing protein [Mucilaginibacter antarcticus]
MKINSESIYSTRPWKTFGEGPAMESVAPLSAQGFNEGKGKPFTGEDIRFVTKGKTLYATLLGWPAGQTALIKTLRSNVSGKVERVKLLGNSDNLVFDQTATGLKVTLPEKETGKSAFVLKIEGSIT